MIKRWICRILLAAMLLSLAACGSAGVLEAETAPETVPEAAQEAPSQELVKALELGLIEAEMLEKRDAPISFQAYTALLDRLVEKTMPERMPQWEERSASFRDNGAEMTRTEGATALLYAAQCLGLDTVGKEYCANLEQRLTPGTDFWKGVFDTQPRIEGSREQYYVESLVGTGWEYRNGYTYAQVSGWFVQHRSFVSGKTYFDCDEQYMLNFGDAFIWEAAVNAVLRLYETARFYVYAPVEQVQCGISPEALAAGAALPEATEQKLPDWYGFSIAMRKWGQGHYAGLLYQEEEIAAAAAQGFNFVRVPLDAQDFFPGEDYTRVNPAQLQNLDQLIDWCARYGIHVCIDLHDMLGFYTDRTIAGVADLFQNPQRQAQFVDFWRFFAGYYKDVPASLLSFNLLNEPHAEGGLTDAQYASVMKPAIEAIRAVTPDRVIVAEMLQWIAGVPSQALVETGVVQSWHPYLVTGGEGFASWPVTLIAGFCHKSNGIFTMTGDFPAGTQVSIDINAFHGAGSLELTADGKTVGSQAFGAETVGEGGCTQIQEAGTGGEFRSYTGRILEVTLPEAAGKLTIRQQGNAWWYNASRVLVDTGAHTYEFKASGSMVEGDKVPNVTLHGDGTVSDSGRETVLILNRDSLLESFTALADFREKTGIQIMAQEWGFSWRVPQEAALGAADALLYAMDALDIPWCSWCQDFGPLMDQREVELRLNGWEKTDVRRPGSDYISISENWIVNQGLMEVYHRYMK